MSAAWRICKPASPLPEVADTPLFWLGTHKPHWLEETSVPLFIANQNLAGRRTLPRARGPWALDSGGFMQLKKTGRWHFTIEQYLENIARYQEEIGQLAWASPMDYMCEGEIRAKTGFPAHESVLMHQHLTTENFVQAHRLWPEFGKGPCPVIPVLQGWRGIDYLDHEDLYRAEGIELADYPLTGLGSVCRRSSASAIVRLIIQMSHLRLHGFGMKRQVLRQIAPMLAWHEPAARMARALVSADSMAWSFDALHNPPLPGHTHRHCGNCLEYALNWRDGTLACMN